MRLSILLLFALGAQASWFGSDTPAYQSWDTQQLTTWLEQHNVPVPSKAPPREHLIDLVKANWVSAQQYTDETLRAAQQSFQHLSEAAFETWDESTLRQFLLDQGVVAPAGPREKLVQLARQRYKDYQSAASSLSYQASTNLYGSPGHQATQSISSKFAAATADVGRRIDDSKDYVYSTWDDNRLRAFLEEKGVLKIKQEATRDDMLRLMREYFSKTALAPYHAWSDSYLHEWLVSHGLAEPTAAPAARPSLLERMKLYHFDLAQKVWQTWSDSELHTWLVHHGLVKSDEQADREKLEKLVAENYANAHDTVWSAWRDSDIRDWLVEHGYVDDAKARAMSRPQLVKTINAKYTDVSARTAPYLVWPDARLRAFLREHGIAEDALPTSRPGLLQEARIRYTLTTTRAEALLQKLVHLLNSGIEIAEEKFVQAFEILSGTSEKTKEKADSAKAKVESEL
ncbi:hypothetical protein EWM64_g9465 [Hericium alpestre]|uniref:Uncharacterized protein n=1 Tax=Hericium alpestre TaxID=135208 RepID=A0A4Y9ZKK1_9AGAM|nr:hypothetical protein EWM64_g9465 [Hericium alpestre]